MTRRFSVPEGVWLRGSFAVLLAAGLVPPISAAAQVPAAREGDARTAAVDVLHYDIRLELPSEGRTVRGRTGILFELLEPGLRELPLDFGALTVDSVHVDGAAAAFRHRPDRLDVQLPPAERGARPEAVIWYHGEPVDGLFLQANRHGDDSVFADNWPNRARHWFPGVDHPSDKATVEFEVEAPSVLDVVANGYLRDAVQVGRDRTRTRWTVTAEIPTYCMVVGATDFAVTRVGEVDGVEVTSWAFPPDSAAAAAAFARAPEILAFYDSLFGPFPYEKLAHVQSSTRFGGMENSSAIFYDEKRVGAATGRGENGDDMTDLVAHETVHQWFGDAVTEKDWHHLWLSEGFAEYFAAVFFEFHGGEQGRGAAELRRRMAQAAATAISYFGETGEAVYNPGERDYLELLNPNNYQKGAWILHMLRRQVGDPVFFEGIQSYYATFRDGTAWTDDFERVMEEASGLDLGWFFEQWVRRPGHPVLAIEHAPAGRGRAVVTLRQEQQVAPFRFPLDLELGWRSGTRREVVSVQGLETSWTFETPEPLETVVLDPDGWLLHEVQRRSR
ncbi:MAG: M1 family metallopeptidase [Gemmatimonadetes bacterium]|nr:M1 family metallopeptidase [Gemmatimonadota bacterium]